MVNEEKDFKKEFEEFARKIKEENNPIFSDDNLEFVDIDNMLNLKSYNFSLKNESNNSNFDFEDLNSFENLDFNEDLSKYPQIDLETDDIKMSLTIKKDYSKISNLENRKKEFIKDLKDFIDEFDSTEESKELMEIYD
ncbi:MAG: hypothetical protein MJ203_00575 [archaeon]|nr:hypothetical protein [archaeon]